MFREINTPCEAELTKSPLTTLADQNKIWVQNIFNRLKMVGYAALANRLSPLDKLLPLLAPAGMKEKANIHNQFIEFKLQDRLAMKDSRPDL